MSTAMEDPDYSDADMDDYAQYGTFQNADEDESVFQEAFDANQSVLSDLARYEHEKKSMFKELEEYLDDLLDRKDSDGKKLISVPKNLDVISQAMSRKDLESDDVNQWSKHLLLKKFDDDMKFFEDGRYRTAFEVENKENKIQQGLAEIHLLDSQLRLASKKATSVNKSIMSANMDSSPRSVHPQDSTFLTRTKLDSSRSIPNSTATSRQPTPRVESSTMDDEAVVDGTEQRDKEGDNEIVMTDVTGDENAEESQKSKSTKKSNRLSVEDEFRLQALLHDDYELYCKNEYSIYQEKLGELDRKLEQFGHLSRLLENNEDTENNNSKRNKNIENPARAKGNDYLEEQRKLRQQREYESRIDKMLQSMAATNDIDYSGLAVPYDQCISSPNSSRSRKSNRTLFEIPSFQEVVPHRTITEQDILDLLQEAKDINTTSFEEIQSTCSDAETSTSQSALTTLASRDDIRKLLMPLQPEVRKLANIRGNGDFRGKAIDEIGSKTSVPGLYPYESMDASNNMDEQFHANDNEDVLSHGVRGNDQDDANIEMETTKSSDSRIQHTKNKSRIKRLQEKKDRIQRQNVVEPSPPKTGESPSPVKKQRWFSSHNRSNKANDVESAVLHELIEQTERLKLPPVPGAEANVERTNSAESKRQLLRKYAVQEDQPRVRSAGEKALLMRASQSFGDADEDWGQESPYHRYYAPPETTEKATYRVAI